MKNTYKTPEIKMIQTENADVLTLSVIRNKPVGFGDDAIRIEF